MGLGLLESPVQKALITLGVLAGCCQPQGLLPSESASTARGEGVGEEGPCFQKVQFCLPLAP